MPTLTFSFSDGKTVVCEVDYESIVTVDCPARGAGGSRINGRVATPIPIREVASNSTQPQFRTLTSVAVA
jgi:hypothetical protein